jgi:2'-5' RNA ligase
VSDTVRAFLAVELPGDVRSAVVRVADTLRRVVPGRARWVPSENVHLTLKFLGNVPEEGLMRLLRALVPRVAKTQPFEVALGGVGAFPNARAARVLWVGIADGASELARLARHLDAATARAGVPRERRPYHGHLTLARLREPARVPVERVDPPDPLRFTVEEVVLFRSDNEDGGPRYTLLARLPLGEARDPEIAFTHPEG